MIEILRERRSIRKFSSERVSEEARGLLAEALLRSPSSRGINPWQFVFVDRAELLQELSAAKSHGASFLKGAPLGIVVCGDPGAADTWVEDCSIASIVVQLVAQSLGLASCWIQIRMRQRSDGGDSERYVRDLLGIPEELRVLSIIAVGHAAEQKSGHGIDTLDASKIHQNHFRVG